MATGDITLITDRFVTLERWLDSEKRHVIKRSNLTVNRVVAKIEHNSEGYFLAYQSPNLNYTVRSMPIMTVEHRKEENCYIISTRGFSDTVYYKLTY